MNTFTRALAGVLAVLGNTVLAGTPVMQAVSTGAANAMIDASGIKERVDSALREQAPAIASATGLSTEDVTYAIDQLDISSWQATALPSDATPTGSVDATYHGIDATVTTYADPSYVTVEAYGQTVTLAVPASAQPYLPYLSYVQ